MNAIQRHAPDSAAPAGEAGSRRSRSKHWILGIAILGLALLLTALYLRSLERPASLVFDAGTMLLLEGHTYQIDLKPLLPGVWRATGDKFGNHRSRLVLMEDGQRLGPAHSTYESILEEGIGRYVHWNRVLIFAASDNSDPRINGRIYSAELSTGISPKYLQRLAGAATLMLLGSGLAAAWLGRRRLLAVFAGAALHLNERRGDILLAALIPSALAAFSLIWLPALWNGSDSVIWLLWQLSWIPHHPPFYPFLMSLLNEATLDAPGMLRATQWVQQIAFVLAVTYVASAFRQAWRILLTSALVCVGAVFGLFAQGFFTEGLAIPLMLFFLGAVLRLHRDGLTKRVATALFLWLLAASLARHALLVLAVVPVTYLFMLMLLSPGRAKTLWVLLQTLALMIGVILANTAATRYVALILDAQDISILGRAGVYRIQAAYELVPREERAAWLARMGAKTSDEAIGHAFPLLAETPDPWVGPIRALLETPALIGHHPDAVMNAAFKAFALSFDPYALKQWRQEMIRAALGTGTAKYCPGLIGCLFQESAVSIESTIPRDPSAVSAVSGTGAEDPASAPVYHELAGHPLTRVLDLMLPLRPEVRGMLLGASLVLAISAAWLGRNRRDAALLASLWVGMLVYAMALTWATVVLPRYLSPIDLLLWLSNALALALITTQVRTSARQQTAPPQRRREASQSHLS